MGKKARIRKEKIETERIEKKKNFSQIYHEKNPWLKFWKRVDFWIYLVCAALLIAYPFVNNVIHPNQGNTAIIHTSMGDITMQLYPTDAPKTVENFKKLAKDGFYDGLLWHRVIKDFMIQTGDPNGDGTGGPGYTIDDEFGGPHKFEPGTVGMANTGQPNSGGSQFFIVTEQAQPSLDGKYSIFGQVTQGMDVVKLIAAAPTNSSDKPLSDIKVNSIEIK